jgi:glucokinase
MVFIGIDLGGTNIKGGIYDGKNVLVKDESITGDLKAESVIKNIAALIKKMLESAGLGLGSVAAVGAGVPGMIDTKNGIVLYNNNLGWLKVNFGKILQKELGRDIPVFISNDANIAALGESEFGAAKEYSDSVMITLGTGVGGGVIINNKIFDGNMGAGAELGHMVIKMGGEKCTCGRKGCFESYCSATALIRQTVKAMKKQTNSQLWDICGGNVDKVNGKTAFDAYYTDKTAKKVVDNYITYLAEGICNLANIFRPQAIILGGGISKQGEMLINLVKKKFERRLYGTKLGPQVELRIASLRNDAGFLGAVAYAMQRIKTDNNEN